MTLTQELDKREDVGSVSIVGLGKGLHDSNICASINGKLKYAKFERHSQIKHGKANEAWYWDVLNRWGIKYPNFLIYTDRGEIGNVPRLPLDGESFIQVNGNQYLLDHHLAHVWSNTKYTEKDQAICIDGKGSGLHTVLIKKDKLYRSKNFSPANLFNRLGNYMGLIKDHEFGNAAGKIMGLIAYGHVDDNLYLKMKDHSLDYISNFCNLAYKENNQEWQNILATVDKVCFDFVKKVFSHVDKNKEVFYSGGVALNVQWNTLLHKMGYNLNLEPHPYDGGLSIGCVRWAHNFLKIKQPVFENFPYIQEPYDSDK